MSISRSVLVYQDEHQPGNTLLVIFQRAGLAITKVCRLEEILEVHGQHFDLIFIELSLPGNEGIYLLSEIRCLYPGTPIILLSGQSNLEAALADLPLEIDDCFIKPVDPGLLLARVEDILSGKSGNSPGQDPGRARHSLGLSRSVDSTRFLSRGAFSLDLLARNVTIRSRLVPLSPVLFAYLAVLVRHAPEPVSAGHLLFEAEGRQISIDATRRIVWRRISALRQAVEQNPDQPKLITNVRGIGYRLAIDQP